MSIVDAGAAGRPCEEEILQRKEDSVSELPPPPLRLLLHTGWSFRGLVLRTLALPRSPWTSSGVPSTGDDWSLVRLKDGRVGWVLARMLSMALPDEVAQYAEGKRITAFLSLGEVKDKDGVVKHNWLWTTQGPGLRPYEFDSFRVFVWSLQRHRYETALIERNVKGFYPIEPAAAGRAGPQRIFAGAGGERRPTATSGPTRFSGYHVRMISKAPYQPPAGLAGFPHYRV